MAIDARIRSLPKAGLAHPYVPVPWPGTLGMTGIFAYCRSASITLTATQSTTFSSYTADKAVEGNDAGAALSATTKVGAAWWQVALPVGYGVAPTQWGIKAYNDPQRPNNFSFEGSDDGATWTTLYSQNSALTGGAWNGGDMYVDPANTAYRYIRIAQPDNGNANGEDQLTLLEVEVWGQLVTP